ncbi:MAG: hypothetical protein AB1487_08950 [Thermodesulfobacteriota bacterium]
MMECKKARTMIEACRKDREFAAHLEVCADCRGELALWDLLGEAQGLEPGLEFTERVLEKVKEEGRQTSWRDIKDMLGRCFIWSGTLDEFSDFPPDSFGAVLFGSRRD